MGRGHDANGESMGSIRSLILPVFRARTPSPQYEDLFSQVKPGSIFRVMDHYDRKAWFLFTVSRGCMALCYTLEPRWKAAQLAVMQVEALFHYCMGPCAQAGPLDWARDALVQAG